MTTVIVTFHQPGYHCWPKAPQSRKYLADSHRHNFHFRLELEVLHVDREVELHTLLDEAKKRIWMTWPRSESDVHALNFGSDSCEEIATSMAQWLRFISAEARWCAVEVWEDGEVGARVELRK